MIRWSVAANERDKELGARLLCRNAEELGVPYSWVTVMSSLIYPMEDNGFMIGRDDSGRVVAALAYTLGTMEDSYADRSRVEVHLLFFERRLRRGRPLLQAMSMAAEHWLELAAGVREVVFFAPVAKESRRLYGKFAQWQYMSEQPCGQLDFYATTPERVLEFTERFRT
ncbi:hypothetical protein [Cohnella sp.]|uniref:hypothetical protein n=1 Tax=Cohnella sp. TaxID=1883426 RepID=UPI0035696590